MGLAAAVKIMMTIIKDIIMKKLTIAFVISLLALFSAGGVFAAMTSNGGYQIWADVISVGGIDQASSTGGFYLDDTLGEPITGKSSSTNNNIGAGFQEMVKGNILSLSISPSSLSLGTLSTGATASTTHSLYLECNATSGVSVTFTGSPLTSGSSSIPAISATATVPTVGSSEFGFNAIRTSGSVSNSVAPYNDPLRYAFGSGDRIISSAGPMGTQEQYTLKYIADMSSSQAAGTYSSAITYTALANF